MAELLLLMQAATTLCMVGLIWFVQVVHYPLFGQVGRRGFANYEQAHQARTTLVVAPLMLLEASTALLLLFVRPFGVETWAVVLGVLLVGVIWCSTFCWQVPAHARLLASFDPTVHWRLVQSNWVRTISWTARGGLVCWMLYETCRLGSAI